MDQLQIIQSKILDPELLRKRIAYWRFRHSCIVFTNGCFDILHRGHVEYLAKAASLGNILIVGLNSDESVSRIKGIGRPIQDEESRSLLLAALSFVDAVVVFNEDTPLNLIELVQPDILAKGGDYQADNVVGNDLVSGKGGKTVIIELSPGYSTTNIEKKLAGK